VFSAAQKYDIFSECPRAAASETIRLYFCLAFDTSLLQNVI